MIYSKMYHKYSDLLLTVMPVKAYKWHLDLFKSFNSAHFTFTHVTLCISAVFAVAWCLSVHPSHWCISIQLAEDIVKLLSRPVSLMILGFYPEHDTQFQGEPVSGGAKYMGVAYKWHLDLFNSFNFAHFFIGVV